MSQVNGLARAVAYIVLALVSLGGLLACGVSSPGGPLLRKDIGDGFGPLVPGCLNVSPSGPPLSYQTKFYLSTWSSAWAEGAQSGLQSGLRVDQDDRSRVRFTKELSSAVLMRTFGFDGNNYPYPQFCMLYKDSPQKVAGALAGVVRLLGNSPVRDEEALGIFGTKFQDREHQAARWRDRYIITVRETTSGTAVLVFRDLWISRGTAPYVQAESNGGNEAWILQRVALQLR